MSGAEVMDRIKITQVWQALGGGSLRRGRGRAFWRNEADGLNVSVSDAKGCWHDFVSGDSGGILDLVQHVRGGSRAEALQYVADISGVTLDSKRLSRTEKRVYAERREQGTLLAQQVLWWASAYLRKLEITKAAANETGDWNALAWSARELYVLQRAVPSAVMDRFLNSMREDPEATNSFVEAGREDERHAYAIATAITIMLASSAEQKEAGRAA